MKLSDLENVIARRAKLVADRERIDADIASIDGGIAAALDALRAALGGSAAPTPIAAPTTAKPKTPLERLRAWYGKRPSNAFRPFEAIQQLNLTEKQVYNMVGREVTAGRLKRVSKGVYAPTGK